MRKLVLAMLAVLLALPVSSAHADDPIGEPAEIDHPALEVVTGGAARPVAAQTLPRASGGAGGTAASGGGGPVTFYPNVKLPCSTDISGPVGCGQLLEPEVASGPDGTIYVTAQEGVPGGVNLWRRDPGSFTYVQLPKPDRNEPLTSGTGLAVGGGDNDLAVSTDGKVYVASLSLASASVSTSLDRGETFAKNETAANFAGVDRQWMTSVGADTVYLSYHDIYVTQIWLVKSTDGGATFGAPQPVIPPALMPQFASLGAVGTGNITSDLVADPDGRVAMAFIGAASPQENFTPGQKPHNVYVAVTDPDGGNPVVHTVFEGDPDSNLQGLFPAIAVDRGGNLYASWTDLHGVFVSVSRDHGETWSSPVAVSSGGENASTVFPFIVGGARRNVGVAWLGTSAASNDQPDAQWTVQYAISSNATDAAPTWTQVPASDHVVHTGSICLEGLTCDLTGGNRNLAEVLQMGLTRDGRVLIAYPDDSATSFGWSYIAEQRFGPGLYGRRTRPPVPVDEPGGPVTDPVEQTGTAARYLVGGEAGTSLQDPDGNVVDAPGDVAAISESPGSQGHVASANLWTTTFGGAPLTFDGEPLGADQILGGTLSVTAFLQEPTAEAFVGTINARLLDVGPDGQAAEIASGGSGYQAGIAVTQATYDITVPVPYEVLAGHHLRLALSFTCFCSTTMRFYYGDGAHPAGFTIGEYQRI